MDKELAGTFWTGVSNDYSGIIVGKATDKAIIKPKFIDVALINIEKIKVLKLSFSKKM